MVTSLNGICLIKSFEGFKSHAYKPVKTEKYYTIGYGHYGSDVKANDTITEEDAVKLLQSDLRKFENKVDKYESTYKFNQNQYDALVSFCYNIGSIDQLVACGTRTLDQIKAAWCKYNKAGGKVLAGLTSRREKELQLFNTPVCTSVEDIQNDNVNVILDSNFIPSDYIITASSLRIREGCGTEYKQVGSISCNNIVHVIHLYHVNDVLWGQINEKEFICVFIGDAVYAKKYLHRNIVEYSLSRDGEKKISDNFKVKEFKCKDGSDKILIDHYLVYYLQLIRNHFGKSVNINSGYRSPAYNKKVGGAKKSQHLQGCAADIHVTGISPLVVAQYAEELGMLGIGMYTNFTHVDTRETKSFWVGSNQVKKYTFK